MFSGFDSGAEGWTLLATEGPQDPGSATPAHSPTNGNPGGYIWAKDSGSDFFRDFWSFRAPASWSGDLLSAYGGRLSFDLAVPPGESPGLGGYASITGNGGTITAGLRPFFSPPETSTSPPGTAWTSYSFDIRPHQQGDEHSWSFSHGGSPDINATPASRAEIRSVLADVDAVRIYGDLRISEEPEMDSAHLDNVRLADGPPQPPPPDRVAPNTTISQLKVRSRKRRATVRFSADEPASFECRLDEGARRACRSPRIYRGLEPGRHRVSVVAIDAAGNRDGSPATRRFRIRKKR